MTTLTQPYRIRLSRDEERLLWQRMRDGDEDARHQLIESQIPYAMRLASRFRARHSEYDDLVQVGFQALMESLDDFDPAISRLSTYCTRAIVWAMLRFDQQNTLITRPARTTDRHVDRWNRAAHRSSLDVHVAGDEPAVQQDWPDLDAERTAASVRHALRQLAPRSRYVVLQRSHGVTLAELAEQLHLCRERVRQIEAAALQKLREALETSDADHSMLG